MTGNAKQETPQQEHRIHIRLLKSFSVGIIAISIAVIIGMCGYHYFESMSWVDSFANATMILSGMGPFGPLQTEGGKIFAGIYALFSGLFFIFMIALVFAPLIHRFLTDIHQAK